jgi:putative CocE/NonD family hydrolase
MVNVMLKQESIKMDMNLPARMRDGVTLYADVYRPDGNGRFPAILTRLPYGMVSGYMNPLRFVRAGYAVVIQDIRGTGASEGEFYPRVAEMNDGYDSVEWAAAQPWCDGNVGMYGMSHLGYTQWAAAVTSPPHLKAICPMATQAGARPFNSGALRLNHLLSWASIFPLSELARRKLPPEKARELRDRIIYLKDNIEEQYWFLPLKDVPSVKVAEEMGLAPFFYSDYLTYHDDEEFWKKSCSPAPLENVTVPCLHICGWHDLLTGDVLASYTGMMKRGGSEEARNNQKVILGPWIHSTEMSSTAGDMDFGVASTGGAADITGVHIRWFDRWLKGIKNGIMEEPRVRVFVMGKNVWRDENEWPLARTKFTRYYFHSGGNANSREGDGSLTTAAPGDEPVDSYLYNPRNPAPTKPGLTGGAVIMGAYDQQETEKRSDILVYSSEILSQDIEITGPIVIKLYAATSAPDTDFTGKLVDVFPDGRAYNLVDGIVRAKYRNSEWKAEPIQPARIYEYSVDMEATSNVFKAGHRIRVEISSSSFPKWERNLNTGHEFARDAEIETALQKIFHSRRYPSHIIMPVIPS